MSDVSPHAVIDGCRSCGSSALETFLDLGVTPLADGLVPADRLDRPEPVYPLTVAFCKSCTLVQIKETVPPQVLFGDEYPYFSSFSDALLEHSRLNVEGLIERLGLDETSLAVELASNDGYLLQFFQKAGVQVLGIDPSPGPVGAALERGIPTRREFFDLDVAKSLVEEGLRADVIVANNVLAHVPDQNMFVAGIAALLAPTGFVSVEVPYVVDLVDHGEVDTIYHEHHCYFSVESISRLFERHKLRLVDLQHHPIHGGTLRAFFSREGQPTDSVAKSRAAERAVGALDFSFYSGFAERVETIRRNLVSLLGELKSSGASIAAYGAAAKGSTMLNYTSVGTEFLDYVVDRNVHKQGRYMPGVRLPIHAPERLLEDQPDYVLILAWNFADEIVAQQSAYLEAGGKFIVPVPEPKVIT